MIVIQVQEIHIGEILVSTLWQCAKIEQDQYFSNMRDIVNNNNNNRYLGRVTRSVSRTVIHGGSDVQIELEFRNVGFCGGRKTEEPREKLSDQGENQQQIQPT